MAEDERKCARCGVARPVVDFPKDARLKAGVRSVCKPCDRAAVRERRRPGGAKPGALVLVPAFPAPPVPTSVGDLLRHGAGAFLSGELAAARAPRAGSLVAEVDRTLEKLDPPPGPADAAIVGALYRVAELLDDSAFGLDRVKDAGTLLPKYVQLLRELKATRASAAAGAPAKPVGKLGRFGAAGSA